MLPRAWTPLRYHEEQARLWRSPAKKKLVVAGRGSGKTVLARRHTVRWLPVRKPWTDPMYFYALPTYRQARRVAWDPIKALVPPEWIPKNGISESSLVIRTIFGSELHVVGMDKPQRIEGSQWDGGVVDEMSDQRPGVVGRNILPALSHRDPWLWLIGVSKRFGVGAPEFKRLYKEWSSAAGCEVFTWPSWDIVDAETIAWARENLDERDFNEQFGASWQDPSGLIFYAFNADKMVTREAEYDPSRLVYVGSDFNVDPMSWVLGHVVGDKLRVFDEISLRNANTPGTLDVLHRKYGQHKAGWHFIGDASARARKTSAVTTDYVQIHNDSRFSPKKISYPKANPPLAVRFAACNALFMNAAGKSRFELHPRCVNVKNDLEVRAYKEGTREPDDSDKTVGHMSDAVGYVIHRLFPVSVNPPEQTPRVHVTA